MAENDQNQGGKPNPDGGTPGGGADGGTDALTFDSWLEGQPDEVKGLIETHTAGLKSALKSERKQRNELAQTLKDATGELEKGTKAREALEGLSTKLEEQEQQLAFYDAAQEAGVSNFKLAWIAAREAGAIDKNGRVNMETLQEEYPELFRKAAPPPGNAGSGANNSQIPGAQGGMDALIRQSAGVS